MLNLETRCTAKLTEGSDPTETSSTCVMKIPLRCLFVLVTVGLLVAAPVAFMPVAPTVASPDSDAVGDPPPLFIPPPPSGDEELEPPLQAHIIEYEVQLGDTMWDIAAEYSTDPESLAVINEMENWNRLQPGETVRVLTISGLLHRADPDDTVEGIAERYQIDARDLIAVNHLRPGDELSVGQELILPHARPEQDTVLAARGELFQWPLQGRITSYFGYRWGRMHSGIDIAAPHGTPIEASRAGRVTFAGWRGGYGQLIILDHGDGKTSWYAHLSSMSVGAGQLVDRGQVIGHVGTTGRSTGPHLHFEIRVHDDPRNPLDYLP